MRLHVMPEPLWLAHTIYRPQKKPQAENYRSWSSGRLCMHYQVIKTEIHHKLLHNVDQIPMYNAFFIVNKKTPTMEHHRCRQQGYLVFFGVFYGSQQNHILWVLFIRAVETEAVLKTTHTIQCSFFQEDYKQLFLSISQLSPSGITSMV